MEKIERKLFDDFDNSVPADHRVIFSVDDRFYRIDLTHANYQRFIDAVRPYVEAALSVPRPSDGADLSSISIASDQEIREWARSQGLDVPDRGRVRRSIVTQYYEAQRP